MRNKSVEFTKSYNGYEIVESRELPCPEWTWKRRNDTFREITRMKIEMGSVK